MGRLTQTMNKGESLNQTCAEMNSCTCSLINWIYCDFSPLVNWLNDDSLP